MTDLYAVEDHTQYRRRKTAEVVERSSKLDGPASRLTDDECGPDRIPKEVYTSRDWFDLEKEYLWPHVWQIACREHDIPEVGDYFEYEIVDETILIVRTGPATIKGYFNVCQHRGRKLKEGCGRAERLRCGYHGWCWDLEGNVVEILDPFDFRPETIRSVDLALKPVQVDTWGGFVFVNMDSDAPPLSEAIAPMPARVDRYLPERLRLKSWKRIVLPINWKVGVDAFHEGYHAFGTHPQLAGYMDDTRTGLYERWDNGMTLLGASNWLETMAMPSRRFGINPDPKDVLMTMLEDLINSGVLSGDDLALLDLVKDMEFPPGDEGLELIRSMFAGYRRTQMATLGVDVSEWPDSDVVAPEQFLLFPNTVGPLQLGTGLFFRFRPNGDDHRSCIFDYWDMQFYPLGEEPDVTVEDVADTSLESWGQLVYQDLVNLLAVGRGMRSRGFSGPRFGYQENNLKFYYRKLAEMLGWKGQPRVPAY
jgi:phenylpropionate dioxygenase-like ring-hydroxylating dioxygenase large terminal subunit